MDQKALQEQLERLTQQAAQREEVALLCRELDDEAPLYAHRARQTMRSASLIKVPILLAALELVRREELRLDECLFVEDKEILPGCVPFDMGPRTASVRELINWMTILSDNTATNVVLERIGMGEANRYFEEIGLTSTILRRKMGDWEAKRAGRDNHTSPADMDRTYTLLFNRQVLDAPLCELAQGILERQRDARYMRRYIWEGFPIAHKTGTQDGLSHDAGVLCVNGRRVFLGVFAQGARDKQGDKAYLGRVGRLVVDYFSALPPR